MVECIEVGRWKLLLRLFEFLLEYSAAASHIDPFIEGAC